MNYIARLYDFLGELSANNDRGWFAANKPRYDELRALWLEDVDRMISAMSAWDGRLGATTASKAAYRIYRDTRFSHDKTPYKTFFSCAISPMGRRDLGAGYYLQTGLSANMTEGLYAGLWCPPSDQLNILRRAIVDNIEEWEEILSRPELKGYFPEWVGETLRTAPKGWPKDHPQIELLRRKDFGRMMTVDRAFFADPEWPVKAAEAFRAVSPLVEFINYSIFEEADAVL